MGNGRAQSEQRTSHPRPFEVLIVDFALLQTDRGAKCNFSGAIIPSFSPSRKLLIFPSLARINLETWSSQRFNGTSWM